MCAAVDSTGIDMQPLRDNNLAWTFFFELFILVGAFFIMNLFIGALCALRLAVPFVDGHV